MADGSLIFDTKLSTSGLKEGISSIGGLASSAFSITAKAVASVGTGLAAGAAASIKFGSTFEASMSTVAATMGMTAEEINAGSKDYERLAQAAKDAGSTTKFSASQAAEALNYMALAGYDVDQSIETLPTVLNLAAAGGIDLASASDMVTDSMSALGDMAGTTESFVDKMAKTSQKSNTSVAQLGEAILTVGGTAKNLAGGVDEMNTALGILADNGTKGAEGGTALRNIILSLSAPTDKAADALDSLGVSAFDSDGNMRPLNETFKDLDSALSTMSQGEKTQVLNEIFNKVDLKSVDALLANCGGRFDELSGYISDCDGAAANMAETMENNLQGQITKLKSALEGLGISVYEQMDDVLKGAVELGNGYIDTLANALKENGPTGLVDALGDVIADLVTQVATYAPQIVDMAISLLDSFVSGLSGNTPIITTGAVDIITTLVQGMISLLPQILEIGLIVIENLAAGLDSAAPSIVSGALTVITTLVQSLISLAPQLLNVALSLIQTLATGLGSSLPTLLPAAVDVIVELVDAFVSNADMIVDGAIALILGLADGLVVALPKLIAAVPRIIQSLVQAIINNAPKLLVAALQLVLTLAQGIISSDFTIVSSVLDLINRVKETFLNTDWKTLGKNIVDGAVQGVSQFASNLINQVGDLANQVFNKFKNVLGIHSPSRKFKWLGQMSVAGYDEALQEYDPYVAFSNRLQSTGAVLRANFVGSGGAADSSQIEFDYKAFGKATAEAIEDSGLTITVGDKVLGRIIRRYV